MVVSPSLAVVFAHLGHVLIDVPIFLGPVLLLLVALAVHSAHTRKR